MDGKLIGGVEFSVTVSSPPARIFLSQVRRSISMLTRPLLTPAKSRLPVVSLARPRPADVPKRQLLVGWLFPTAVEGFYRRPVGDHRGGAGEFLRLRVRTNSLQSVIQQYFEAVVCMYVCTLCMYVCGVVK